MTVVVCVIDVYRDVIFCVLIQPVILKKVHVYLTFIQQYVNIITVFCDEGKMSIMLRKCSKSGTYSVPASVTPGRGTNRLKTGTSRRKRDGWQPYKSHNARWNVQTTLISPKVNDRKQTTIKVYRQSLCYKRPLRTLVRSVDHGASEQYRITLQCRRNKQNMNAAK